VALSETGAPPADQHAAALDPPRAYGAPLGRVRVRTAPEDFCVEECLGFAPAGAGAHVLLRVRKRDANTAWVAGELARIGGCRPFEVGYAGLKDRRAVAVQWFTVPRGARGPQWWREVRGEGFAVLEAHGHTRKLPRGALEGNRFRILARGAPPAPQALQARLERIGAHGVPNYFGPQRFGRDGGNLANLPADPSALRPAERGFVLSAARSLLFNAVLAERVRTGRWCQLEAGDRAQLEGRGSHFPVEVADATLHERAARLEIHPSGPLWGQGEPDSGGAVRGLETDIVGRFPAAAALLEAAGMRQERRSLRLAVHELEARIEPDGVLLQFRLTRGAYATAVLRELFVLEDYESSST
jgi:tRNA pseudouridine13 synthase